MGTQYRHLELDDRIQIEKLRDGGATQASIARTLGVHRATISRELRRGRWRPSNTSAAYTPYRAATLRTGPVTATQYRAVHADRRATTRAAASHQPHRMRSDALIAWVIDHLRRGWTPEEISGRLPREFPEDPAMRVCSETLYAWIYSKDQRHRELWQYLPRARKRRRRRGGRRTHCDRFKWRTSIHDRPAVVEDRLEFGHWESDSVLGAPGTGALHTTVERASRYLQAVRIPDTTAKQTLNAQLGIYQELPGHAVRSVTADNGSEFALHYQLADVLAVPTYFADPYSAWQRGTNEHFNGRIRKYLPKRTSFADLSQEELDEFIVEINNRPRKCLQWMTPAEVFQELCWDQATLCCASA